MITQATCGAWNNSVEVLYTVFVIGYPRCESEYGAVRFSDSHLVSSPLNPERATPPPSQPALPSGCQRSTSCRRLGAGGRLLGRSWPLGAWSSWASRSRGRRQGVEAQEAAEVRNGDEDVGHGIVPGVRLFQRDLQGFPGAPAMIGQTGIPGATGRSRPSRKYRPSILYFKT